MDTFVSITIYSKTEPANWRTHAAGAIAAMRDVERTSTSYNDSSEIGKVNSSAGHQAMAINREVVRLIAHALEISDRSGGAFDVTVFPLVRLWDVKSPTPVVPTAGEIDATRRLVDYKKVVFSDTSVFLPDSGMGIDLGAIAKGYAVDRATQILLENHYRDFLVEAGGDLRAVAGELTRGRRTIWVRHPRQPDRFFASIKLDEGAVATSGDYERSFEREGKRYHHIIDPSTGYPATPTVSVTIVAETSELADATSTAVFVMGPDRGMEYLESQANLAGLIVYQEPGSILKWKISKNLVDRITILEK